MQKKRKKKLILVASVLLILYLLTLGIRIELDSELDCRHPQGDSVDTIGHVTNPPYMNASVFGRGYSEWGIPYLLWGTTDTLPSDLDVAFWVNYEGRPDGVVVSSLKIKYRDGKTYTLVKPSNPATDFFDTHQTHSSISTIALIKLPKAIKHRSSFVIEAKGYLYDGDEKTPFERTIKAKYVRQRYMGVGWLMYLMRDW